MRTFPELQYALEYKKHTIKYTNRAGQTAYRGVIAYYGRYAVHIGWNVDRVGHVVARVCIVDTMDVAVLISAASRYDPALNTPDRVTWWLQQDPRQWISENVPKLDLAYCTFLHALGSVRWIRRARERAFAKKRIRSALFPAAGRWRDHMRYRPGGVGYLSARQSFWATCSEMSSGVMA